LWLKYTKMLLWSLTIQILLNENNSTKEIGVVLYRFNYVYKLQEIDNDQYT